MTRTFWLANLVILLDEVVYLALIPLLPEYAERFDLSKAGSGFLYAAYPLFVLLSSIPAGVFADRLGGRRMLLAGCGILVVATFGFAFAASEWQLWLCRAAQGLTAGLVATAGMATIAAGAEAKRRATTIGIAVSLQGASAIAGYALGGFLAPQIGSERAFLVPAAIGVALFAALLLDRTPPLPLPPRLPLRTAVLSPLRSVSVRAAIACILAVGLAASAAQTLTALGLDEDGYSTSEIGTTFIVGAAIAFITTPLAGWAADRYGVVPVMRVWSVLLPLVVIGLAVADQPTWVVAALLVGVLTLVRIGGTLAYARAAENRRLGDGLAAGYGLAVTAWSVGAVAGPLIAGAIADAYASWLAFAIVAALAALLAIPASRRD